MKIRHPGSAVSSPRPVKRKMAAVPTDGRSRMPRQCTGISVLTLAGFLGIRLQDDRK